MYSKKPGGCPAYSCSDGCGWEKGIQLGSWIKLPLSRPQLITT